MMEEGIKNINEKIATFKRRYYQNYFVRGAILVPSILLGYFLIVSLTEYALWLDRPVRFFIFLSFIVGACVLIYVFFKKPLRWLFLGKGLNEEESAKIIGKHFPSVSDRLLNIIQLSSAKEKDVLTEASILQKSRQLDGVSFEKAVDIKSNKKYLRFLLIPCAAVFVLLFVNSNIFTTSTKRIVRFDQEFSPEAPFHFLVESEKLSAFFNEDFILTINTKGSSLPDAAYLIFGRQRLKMEKVNDGKFQYVFEKLQHEVNFQVEASGFFSDAYKITLVNRPELSEIKISFSYPAYIGKHTETITNAGNIEVPEGTQVSWQVKAGFTNNVQISFSAMDNSEAMQNVGNQLFKYQKGFKNNDQYTIILGNSSSNGDLKISYSIDVIKDQFPQINVENLRDSILYKSILLGGQLKDDYGITNLKLIYQLNQETESHSINIPTSRSVQQNFYYLWKLDSLHLSPGDKLNYYLQVWDNDGVNGRKSARSANYVFSLPGVDELKTIVAEQQQLTEKRIDNGVEQAKELKRTIEEAQQKLRGKNNLDWQEKKLLEDLVNQKKKLDENIKNLQEENRLLEKQKETFTSENEKIKEKSEQIQKLMDELLDDETKKLFDELEKLLKENVDTQQIQKLLEKMDRREINIEQELERALELFKQLQYEYKLDQAINELEKQEEKQKNLLNETKESLKNEENNKNNKEGDKTNEKSTKELAKDQDELQKNLKDFKKSVEDLKKLGEEIKEEDKGPSEEDLKELNNEEENSKESLDQNQPQKSINHQQKALGKMKEMKNNLKEIQNSMQMEMDTKNLESIRQIVHGLIKLSYDQENLMKEFNAVQQSDPKYIQLSQNQINIQNDSKVLEDSLLSLSKKDPFLSNIVTREINDLNDHIDKVVGHIKERRKGNASSEMQFSMTNINNLALMLNNHFDMMMDAMAKASGKPSKSGKGEKNGMNLGKMQMEINQEIQKLKGGQKVGRQFSEDLAKLAAEQERIRRALKEMQDQLKREGGKDIGGDLPGKMEQTEMDLVNKQITDQTIRRQNEILTRLLEAEKSLREQDLDKERKGEAAKEYQNETPRQFEQYLRLKEKEVELLKSLPPAFFPYYKGEANEYFKRIK